MTTSLTVECKVHFTQARHGRKQMAVGDAPVVASVPLGRVPRLARLMALAIRFESLLKQGELSRVGKKQTPFLINSIET